MCSLIRLIPLLTISMFAMNVSAHDDAHGPQQPKSMAHPSDMHSVDQHASALGKPATPLQTTRTIHVAMDDTMRFSPDVINVKRGEKIRFVVTNNGQLKHEMVLGTPAELKEHAALMARFPTMEHDDPNAISLPPLKTGELAWNFSKTGHFIFACLVPGHFEAGMMGNINVQK